MEETLGVRLGRTALRQASVAKLGDYQLDIQIGSGTTGTVWKAHRNGPVTRVVALKRLHGGTGRAGDLDRIQREAAVLTELEHPHIVRMLDVLTDDDGGLALAMQFASGGSFDVLLAERGRLPAGEVVAVAAPVADALASAHRRGILHGDVKPANILFTSDGEPLLGDFGVARALGTTTEGQVAGSAAYLAPELLDGSLPNPRADVSSLAVVCYEALAGKQPFEGEAPLAVLRAADAGEHSRLSEIPGVPQELAEVVELAMDRDPGRRFGTADDFASSLRSSIDLEKVRLPGVVGARLPVLSEDATSATDTYGPRPPVPEPPRQRLLVRLGAVALRRVRLVARKARPLFRGAARGAGQRRLATAGLGAGLLLVVFGVVLGSTLKGSEPGRDCPDDAAPDLGPDAQLLRGDTDGDGCATYGVYELRALPGGYEEMVLTFTLQGDERYMVLGEPGDQLFFGDWYCEGRDTPALYRPAHGEVHYFDSWPEAAGEEHSPAGVDDGLPVNGTAEQVPGGDAPDGSRCDRLRITP